MPLVVKGIIAKQKLFYIIINDDNMEVKYGSNA
jgi:hypothetical protein